MIQENRLEQQALADEHVLDLAKLGLEAAKLYGTPQDIEWAWVGGRLYLLQSRPITSLFPLLEGVPETPLKVFFSFAAVQGMLDPVTPLGRDALKLVFTYGARLFGIRVTSMTQNMLFVAGERLWANITTPFRNSFGRRMIKAALAWVEPSTAQALDQIWAESSLQPRKPGVSLHARSQIARFFIPLAANVFLNLAFPRRRREYIISNGENVLKEMEDTSASFQGDRQQRLAQAVDLLDNAASRHLISTLRLFVSGVVAGIGSWNLLRLLASSIPAANLPDGAASWEDLVLRISRGMPHNPTTEMDLELWDIARIIRSDPSSRGLFNAHSPAELSSMVQSQQLPPAVMEPIGRFLARYGSRGLAEIDLGRERWIENPQHVFEMLCSFLLIKDESLAPDVVFSRGAQFADEAVDLIVKEIRKTPKGWFKARLARFLAGRARQLMGMRESPKFFAVRMMGIVRKALLEIGTEYVQAGELNESGDLFYLTFAEIKALAGGESRDWASLIAGRRESYLREMIRRQIPRLILSDGRAFYEGMFSTAGPGMMSGSPVSPGTAEGLVRVVFDPGKANLQPGEILVCPGTDPSWTPLFLSAAGLVMEVGGMMTHGAVVAREYGIPAIVGVDQVTQRLVTGQRIRIDGSSGQIALLDGEPVDSSSGQV